MMNGKHLKVGVVLLGVYVLLGVIIFPGWYIESVQRGGIGYLIHEAQTTYFVESFIAFVVISSLVGMLEWLMKNKSDVYDKVYSLITGKFCLSTLIIILLMAIFRVVSISAIISNSYFKNLSEKVEGLEKRRSSNVLIANPIEILFVNKEKFNGLYSQIAPLLELSEAKINYKSLGTSEGRLGSNGIASVSGRMEESRENSEKYTVRDVSLSEKVKDSINHFGSTKDLVRIQPINVESRELSAIKNAVSIFQKYEISVDNNKVNSVLDEILKNEFENKLSYEYEINKFVLISAPVLIYPAEHDDRISIKFDYLSGKESGVSFSCDIEKSAINKSDLEMFLSKNTWEVNIFGKIIHKDVGQSINYLLSCFSVFR